MIVSASKRQKTLKLSIDKEKFRQKSIISLSKCNSLFPNREECKCK